MVLGVDPGVCVTVDDKLSVDVAELVGVWLELAVILEVPVSEELAVPVCVMVRLGVTVVDIVELSLGWPIPLFGL